MEKYQERVIIEKKELDEKRGKLLKFIAGRFKMSPKEQSQLNRQLEAMTLYSNILEERIRGFNTVEKEICNWHENQNGFYWTDCLNTIPIEEYCPKCHVYCKHCARPLLIHKIKPLIKYERKPVCPSCYTSGGVKIVEGQARCLNCGTWWMMPLPLEKTPENTQNDCGTDSKPRTIPEFTSMPPVEIPI